MGQKVNPIGLRLGINRDWESTWYDEKHFADRLKEDIILRRYVLKKYQSASVSKVEITRTSTKLECFADRVITDLGDDSGVKFSVEIIDGDSFKYYQGQPF